MKFLGLAGKAGHGKDTVAAHLLDMYGEYGVARRAFADALKEDMAVNLVQGGAWEKEWFAHPGRDHVAFINSIKHHPEIRVLLQSYGVAQRKAQPDYWIQRLFRWAAIQEVGMRELGKPFTLVVIPDVRFKNEAQAIMDKGGLVFRVYRPNFDNGLTAEQQRHSSETDLDDWHGFADTIYNDTDVEGLRRQLQTNALQWYVTKGGHSA